jgi:glucosyl-3-phosphoglycerate synthase
MADAPPADARALVAAKTRVGSRISVCLPACNEEATIGEIVATVRADLMEAVPLVDELIVVDDGSTDATAAVAAGEGARVVAESEVLAQAGPGFGKGNALWKSLFVSSGDLVCWLDADVRNFGPHFVTRLVEPLLTDPGTGFVKAYYRRPLHGERDGGGRVTELVARPLISHLFPKLAHIVQPLAGEYAGRRSVLEAIPFVQGWGVEIGLLIDVMEHAGVEAIAQVDLGVREHRNRPLDQLGPTALAILVTALRRAGYEHDRAEIVELLRFDADHAAQAVPVSVGERPPMSRFRRGVVEREAPPQP